MVKQIVARYRSSMAEDRDVGLVFLARNGWELGVRRVSEVSG